MLARVDHDDLDAGPRKSAPERLCIATRSVKPVAELIRFVVGPEGRVVPDVKRRLPGRGVWVTATREAVAMAAARRAFGRSFKREVGVPPDLAEETERLLVQAALDALAIAHKSGLVAAGFAKTEAALRTGRVVGLLHAADGSPEGVRKLAAAARSHASDGQPGPVTINMFMSAQLDLALGRLNVVHAALLAGPASAGFLARCRSLARFRGEDPGVGGRAAGLDQDVP
jgi:predicted RNA-binding protein YlxR (DUF448 family)